MRNEKEGPGPVGAYIWALNGNDDERGMELMRSR